MPARRDVDPDLLAAARRGELTNSNTQKGTPERRAVDRVKYLRRRSAHSDVSARQAAGHPRPDDVPPRISLLLDGPPRFVEMEALNRRDLRRVGRYDNLVRRLAEGKIAPEFFRRRVAGWQPIIGEKFLADPDAVLALLDERRAADLEVFTYASGRAAT